MGVALSITAFPTFITTTSCACWRASIIINVIKSSRGTRHHQRDRVVARDPPARVDGLHRAPGGAVMAIVVAGMGFFTDAYNLCISLVTKLLGRIYYTVPSSPTPGSLPPNISAAVNGVAFIGTLSGQLFFGWLGDKAGHKRVYGMTLMLMVLCSVASALSFGGEQRGGGGGLGGEQRGGLCGAACGSAWGSAGVRERVGRMEDGEGERGDEDGDGGDGGGGLGGEQRGGLCGTACGSAWGSAGVSERVGGAVDGE